MTYQLGEIAPPLSVARERMLIAGIAAGDRESYQRLATANLPLVASIARRFRGRGLAVEDLIAEGTVGLMRAVGEFRTTHGVRFATYARHWISNAIRDAIRRRRLIAIPAKMQALIARAKGIERTLAAELGRAPVAEEVAAALGLSRTVESHLTRALNSIQLADAALEGRPDEDPDDDGPGGPTDDCVRSAIGELRRNERAVIVRRFGILDGRPMTIRETAEDTGYSDVTVAKLQERATAKLRAMLAGPPECD